MCLPFQFLLIFLCQGVGDHSPTHPSKPQTTGLYTPAMPIGICGEDFHAFCIACFFRIVCPIASLPKQPLISILHVVWEQLCRARLVGVAWF